MSGSGGGRQSHTRPQPEPSGRGGSQGGAESSDPCDINEVTTLNSPNRAILSTLQSGDELNIELEMGPPRQLLAKREDEVAGSITSPNSARIIQCIRSEHRQYAAIVLLIIGGRCDVKIQPG